VLSPHIYHDARKVVKAPVKPPKGFSRKLPAKSPGKYPPKNLSRTPKRKLGFSGKNVEKREFKLPPFGVEWPKKGYYTGFQGTKYQHLLPSKRSGYPETNPLLVVGLP